MSRNKDRKAEYLEQVTLYRFEVAEEDDGMYEVSVDETHGIFSMAFMLTRKQLMELRTDIDLILRSQKRYIKQGEDHAPSDD